MAGGDLVRLARPAERLIGAEARDLLFIEGGGDERRPDRAWGHRVHADALLCERLRQRAGEAHDRALGRTVVEEFLAAAIGGDRGGVYDRCALLQVIEGGFRHEEIAEDI